MILLDRMRLALLAAALLPCLAGAQATAPADTAAQPAAPAAAPAPDTTAQPAQPAPAAPAPAPAKAAAPAKPPVTSSWAASLYGFVEFDVTHDSTQSFQEGLGGNGMVARKQSDGNTAGTGDNGRTIFTGRNTRFGFKLSAPEYQGIKATAVVEADFEGNQPGNPGPGSGTSESSFYVPGTLRLRQGNVKIETPFVDFLVGQTWAVFGWQSYFFPATVMNIPAPVGAPFNRSAQLRVSKTMKSDALVLDAAVAAARPPQRDAEVPDLQAGVRVGFPFWKGIHTPGFGGTTADPLTFAVSGATRQFKVATVPTPATGAVPASTAFKKVSGSGLSLDALIPIIPVKGSDDRGNALTATATFTRGSGIGDLLGGISGAAKSNAAFSLASNVGLDGGLLVLDSNGDPHAIQWTGLLVGAQYYLPPAGRIFVSATYGRARSDNAAKYMVQNAANLGAVWTETQYYDGNVFFDITPAVRTGLSYQYLQTKYADDVKAKNVRYQLTTCFFF